MTIDPTTLSFLEQLNQDSALQEDLATALEGAEDHTSAVVAVATARGFEIEPEAFDTARAQLAAALEQFSSLDETELAAVAGGLNPQPEPPSIMFNLFRTIQPAALRLILGGT